MYSTIRARMRLYPSKKIKASLTSCQSLEDNLSQLLLIRTFKSSWPSIGSSLEKIQRPNKLESEFELASSEATCAIIREKYVSMLTSSKTFSMYLAGCVPQSLARTKSTGASSDIVSFLIGRIVARIDSFYLLVNLSSRDFSDQYLPLHLINASAKVDWGGGDKVPCI